MKHLIFINGTMGVGKTAVCQKLKNMLHSCIFLDGDWCWDMHPFLVNEKTKSLVLDNISTVLNHNLCSGLFSYVLFCWVMQEDAILREVLGRLHTDGWKVHTYTLMASEACVTARIQKDISSGLRSPDVLKRSLARLKNYQMMNTTKIDTTSQTAQNTAEWILHDLRKEDSHEIPI